VRLRNLATRHGDDSLRIVVAAQDHTDANVRCVRLTCYLDVRITRTQQLSTRCVSCRIARPNILPIGRNDHGFKEIAEGRSTRRDLDEAVQASIQQQ
jgi:hypothetical protein